MNLFKIVSNIKIRMLAIFLLSLSGLAVAENETQLVAKINGEISVNANGEVNQILLTNVNDAKLKTYLINKIKSWTFYPMEINGKPVDATSGFTFDLIFTYGSDKSLMEVQFSDVRIKESDIEIENNKKRVHKPSPNPNFNYPTDALSGGAEAKILVAVEVTSEGKVKRADVAKIEIFNADSNEVKIYSRSFARNALLGIVYKKWTPEELIASNCINGCIGYTNIHFVLEGRNGFWRKYQLVPQDPIPWIISAELKDMNELEKSQLVRLKEDPTGKPLEMGG